MILDVAQLPQIFFPLSLVVCFLFFVLRRANSNIKNTKKTKDHGFWSSWMTPLLLLIAELAGTAVLYSLARNQHVHNGNIPMDGCILATGASQGIGKALTMELASRYPNKCILLTSRRPQGLVQVLEELNTEFQATNVTILQEPIDLSQEGSAQKLFDFTTSSKYPVDMLILNAGIGSSGQHTDHSSGQISTMIQLNILQTTSLLQLYSQDMQQRQKGGRILLVSSVTGAVPGLPNGAMYGATKAYLRHLAWGVAAELESSQIGVTVVLPGATTSTNFADVSDIRSAAVWNYPFVVSNAKDVAYHSIEALLQGKVEVFPGRWLDSIAIRVAGPLLPPRFLTWFFGMSWLPYAYSFPPGWKPNTNDNTKEEL